jgi:hypothetical protein
MAKGSEARYLSDTQNLKIAQVRHRRSYGRRDALRGMLGFRVRESANPKPWI